MALQQRLRDRHCPARVHRRLPRRLLLRRQLQLQSERHIRRVGEHEAGRQVVDEGRELFVAFQARAYALNPINHLGSEQRVAHLLKGTSEGEVGSVSSDNVFGCKAHIHKPSCYFQGLLGVSARRDRLQLQLTGLHDGLPLPRQLVERRARHRHTPSNQVRVPGDGAHQRHLLHRSSRHRRSSLSNASVVHQLRSHRPELQGPRPRHFAAVLACPFVLDLCHFLLQRFRAAVDAAPETVVDTDTVAPSPGPGCVLREAIRLVLQVRAKILLREPTRCHRAR
eukprot:1397666-Rhodomonas_salina.1